MAGNHGPRAAVRDVCHAHRSGNLPSVDAEYFRHLLNGRTPFASVCFEDSHDTADAGTQLDLKWRDLHGQLVRHGADEPVIAEFEAALRDSPCPIGRSGRALIADADGVRVDEYLLRPTPTVVRVSELPYLLPIVEHGFAYPNYVLAEVDHTGADVTVHVGGRLRSEGVDGGGYPVHKASGAETAGYGDPQQRTDEAARKNIRAVAERVTEITEEVTADVVYLVGEVRSRSDLLAALPKQVADRAVALGVGARHSGHSYDEVREAIEADSLKRRLTALDDVAQRFTAETGRASGLAAEGLAAVCTALNQEAVETLIVGDIGDATVIADEDMTIAAPDAAMLSEYGAAPAHTLRADEALPIAALRLDAELVCAASQLRPADGIAAVLRYALASSR